MDSILTGLFAAAFNSGLLGEISLLLVVIMALYISYKYYWKPTKENVEILPTLESIKEVLSASNEIETRVLQSLVESLDKIDVKLQDIRDTSNGNQREILDMKRDIEAIREILNQIQGHLLYSKPNNFGNKELR